MLYYILPCLFKPWGIIEVMSNIHHKRPHVLLAGKAVRRLSRLRGGGSALPGLVIEKLDPRFLQRTLANLPHGVVVISGTNGKTTTTKMVVALLEAQGLRVFTNPTGSNFKRGIISAVIEKSDLRGALPYDIAVLELDEAHGALFVRDIAPRFCLLLNVMRDQLDRFGEIDTTKNMLATIAMATREGVVLNGEDKRTRELAQSLDKKKLHYFGLSQKTRAFFPNDDELYDISGPPSPPPSQRNEDDVILEDFNGQTAYFSFNKKRVPVKLRLSGAYNFFNAAAALALVRLICGEKLNEKRLFDALSAVEPAFGRGEKLLVNGCSVELILVKNPSGFRLALGSYEPQNTNIMIAINDNYADGRDMSWLWDVNFSSLAAGAAMVSGIRAYDMALRLQYDEIKIGRTEPNLSRALKLFLHGSQKPKRIFCTYTAMLDLRKELKKYTTLERAL